MTTVMLLGGLVLPLAGNAAAPCCAITAIDARAQTVSAKEAATGRTFQFKVADLRALAGLKVGQPISVDFKTMKASLRLDGAEPCCSIMNLSVPAAAR